MQIIKPAAIIAALLFVLSCNEKADKQATPEINTVSDYKSNATTSDANAKSAAPTDQAKSGSVAFDVTNNTTTNGLTAETEDDGQQEPPGQPIDKKNQQPVQKIASPDWDKKIIKTASVNLEVEDYNKYYASIREKVKSMGGYVAQEEQTQSDYKIENNMVVKVPVDQFDNAVVLLSGNVKKVNERKITSQDVTGEVVDTKSRIESKKQVRQRYLGLLGQAKNMAEILSVQSEIDGMQEEIESATSRVDYMNHASAFSTINLTYFQVLNVTAKDIPKEPQPSFGDKLKNALGTGWEIVSSLFIGIITLWPLILASFFGYLLYKKLRTPKAKQAV